MGFEINFAVKFTTGDNLDLDEWTRDKTSFEKSEVIDFARKGVEDVGVDDFSLSVDRLETFELRYSLHHSALTTHEGSRHLAVTGTGFLTFGTTTSSLTTTSGNTTTSTSWAGISFND